MPKIESKVCKQCGKEFFKKRSCRNWPKIKYCSPECLHDFWNNYKKENLTSYYTLRFNVFKRDNFKCIYCGRSSIEDEAKLELEHLIPLRGKKQDWDIIKENELTTSCHECNIGKSDNVLSLEIIERIKNKEVKKK